MHEELEQARATFHTLLDQASPPELRQPSRGTRWTNEQLLFHMLFGYLILPALLVLVRLFSRLPSRAGRAFAHLLDAAVGPFDLVNYYGSCVGARVFPRRRMAGKFDRVIASLHRRLAAETEADLLRGMAYPVRWDPFFARTMTLADLYHYPTQHFDFHRRQLSLTPKT